MNAFSVLLTAEAQADIRRLSPAIQTRILNRLQWIGDNAAVIPHVALQRDVWRGCLRYRVGDYRIIHQLNQSAEELTVLKVGHRRDIYR